MTKQKTKFVQEQARFQCPICKSRMEANDQNSLICREGHCFDISSKGYINFIPNKGVLKEYDRSFFEYRRSFLNQGFYDHIADAVLQLAADRRCVVDAGCGEGFYALKLSEEKVERVFAFDFAKDAVKIAARGGNSVCWMVADLTNIPLQTESADCMINVFSPANYSEFERVLKRGGMLIKVVPGENHLIELRSRLEGMIRNERYSNQEVVAYFNRNFTRSDQKRVRKTMAIDQKQVKELLAMTPLTFGIDEGLIDCSAIKEITIEGEILVGEIS